MINDRAIQGFTAGILAGIIMAAINFILVSLRLSDLLYANWASVYLMGYIDSSLIGIMVGQIAHLLFAGFTGIPFTVLVKRKEYFQLKGILWGLAIWFMTNAICVLFNIEPLLPKNIQTIIAHAFTAIIYGWVLAIVINNKGTKLT